MTATGGVGVGRFNSLGARIAMLLSLAILPLGLIAVVQTYRVLDEATQRIEAALLGETLRATRPERGLIQTAVGAAQALAVIAPSFMSDADYCRTELAEFVEGHTDIVFAGVVPRSGLMQCSSSGSPYDFSGSTIFEENMQSPRLLVRATRRGQITGLPAILVSAPIWGDDEHLGYVTLSIRQSSFQLTSDVDEGLTPIAIITYNMGGEVMTSSDDDPERTAGLLPRNRSLAALTGNTSTIFRDASVAGNGLIYTVAPLVEDAAFAMAIWSQQVSPGRGDILRWKLPTILLPILMWVASLSVAYFAVHRLVIQHIRRLRKRMRLFSRFRRVESDPDDESLPAELREVTESFVSMAHTIQREEAELENSIREKDLLLREVYHRVRNNLQLIASMNNMQIRAAKEPETRRVLRRLQDRILALATIHGALYQAPALSKVRADDLVVSLAQQVVAKAAHGVEIDVRSETDAIRLYPDTAVPLSLLTVEAVTNATKHLGRPSDGSAPFIEVSLDEHDGQVTLEVMNSVGVPIDGADLEPGANAGRLGMQLINAFTLQLAGDLRISQKSDAYVLTVKFRPRDYGEEHSLV